MEQEKKEENKIENCGSQEIETKKILDKICQANCRICSSGFIEEIHLLRNAGREYSEIIEIIKQKHNYELSPASLSRHFKNYREYKMLISSEQMRGVAVEEANEQKRHTEKVISLIDQALDQIQTRVNSGNYLFDVSEIEKLMNIRHKVLSGDAGAENDLVAVFQKMDKEFSGQLVLLKS